ncbi:MAG: hypothetical protein H0U59_05270 [Gemmatimonadaceae bacterium]|nr:hypothetical protein [Gemmatimonadaceae bacterium]
MNFTPEPDFLRSLLGMTTTMVDPGTAVERVNNALNERLAAYSIIPNVGMAPVTAGRDADRWPYVRREAWALQLANVGAKINSANWGYWSRLQDQFGLPKLTTTVLYLDVTKRWPDRVEQELAKEPVMAEPSEDPVVTRALKIVASGGWEAARDRLSIICKDEQQLLTAIRGNLALAKALVG